MMVFKYRRRRRVVVLVGNLIVLATISAAPIAVLVKILEWPTSSRPSDSIPPPQSLDDFLLLSDINSCINSCISNAISNAIRKHNWQHANLEEFENF
ncbi:hypothetical protein QE152_g6386 [Popillia japonica]|uniref:Uncharacterized protein n=1 Tax=Popillia japonica TaxID=7064 RepID=A0AAW1MKU4_POPJA